ncbi:MAG: WYL domain-containing protein [Actinomycetota bacterium]|nr:WYL domain-containing protein [Actinomycetota bacterium]
MRRIERLINLIAALLETSTPMTADDIRQRIAGYEPGSLEAFRRAFERDKADLRAMGIPIELRRIDPLSETEGYVIPKSLYYLPQLDLEPDELAALKLAAESVLGGGEVAETGLMKLSVDAAAESWSGPRVVWGAGVAAEQPALAALYPALLERRAVSFLYRGAAAGEAARREVDTYGLVHRRGHWYVVGNDRDKGAIRAFKVSRIEDEPRMLEHAYEIPDGFRAEDHVAGEAWELGAAPATATVRFGPDVRWWAQQNHPGAPMRERPGGAVDVELQVSNVDALVSWAIGLGPGVEIVEPASARAAVLDHLAPLLVQGSDHGRPRPDVQGSEGP